MTTRSSTTSENLVNEIISNRKNSNLILQLEERLLSEDDNVASNIQAMQALFLHFLENREMFSSSESHDAKSAQEKYREWLRTCYEDFIGHLHTYSCHNEAQVQVSALDSLMTLFAAEARYPIKKGFSPQQSFQVVIESLVNRDEDASNLIRHLHTYMKQDIQLFTLQSAYAILQKGRKWQMQFFSNMFMLLTKIQHPKKHAGLDESNSLIIKEDGEPFVVKWKDFNKAFSRTWMCFIKCKLPKAVFKKLLLFLPRRVLPYLNQPLLLTDLLSDSYCKGGIISLLSLNGIFYLIQNHNLEYPDFFKRLYSLFSGEVVSSRYRARFFYLADIFLSSTHLPAYLVAAFIKRLARLALVVPSNVVLVILPFIRNLLVRHPSLRILLHNPEQISMTEDPYMYEMEDPAQCNALKSSLWEIKALQNHWNPNISKKAKFINDDLPRTEWSICNFLELTMHDMIKKEEKSLVEEIHMSYDEPTGIFQRKEDTMSNLWTL